MIKVKITKNVINKSVSPLGSAMTPRLIVCTVLGLAAAIATFVALQMKSKKFANKMQKMI